MTASSVANPRPLNVICRSGAGRFNSLKPKPISWFSTGGISRAAKMTNSSTISHVGTWMDTDVLNTVSTPIPAPDRSEISTATVMAVTERRAGILWSRPISAAATMFHTPPGMYLPIWLTPNSWVEVFQLISEPKSARITFHDHMVKNT